MGELGEIPQELQTKDIKTSGKEKDSTTEPSDESLLFKNRIGIREYALTKGKDTEQLLEGVIVQAANLVSSLEREIREDTLSPQDFANKYAPKIVAEVAASHMSSGLSIPRVIMGGKYKLEDVVEAVSCVDAAVFTKEVLKQGFGIESEIVTTRLGVAPTHHYLQLESGAIIDPIVGSKNNPGGFYENEQKFKRTLNAINSGGISTLKKQVSRLIKPKERPSVKNSNTSTLKK